ncbi:sulfite reductase subunit alpha [Rubinisphaera sp.]|uniref:sulfite reductase subunit alpha n=1 Tax=Rubinisphaera sp. TaxID=2024857 RepID=UPI000C0C7C15|nr:sulfite reductase subunit alpha [Rubinisphaera sp.]MBV10728.1 sulfite reductase subunit alpha [Rubinisphaera sp.]|tara:strand:- start:2985 stop:4553 length:1569 start_codon:yes stop_codon:yes gene_type:complete
MSITLIPESAPFSDEQKAWLNGFFAGMLGLEPSSDEVKAEENRLTEQAEAEAEEDFPWHDPGLNLQKRMELAEGKPVERRLMASMAQLDCGACGYVCKTYAEAIASGGEKNLKLCVPGAKETSKMLKKVLSEADEIPAASTSGTPATAETNGSTYHRSNPFPAKLIKSETLNKPGSAKDVRHVEIDLSGSDLHYEVGDALGVYPTNCNELVEGILDQFSEDRTTTVSVGADSMSFVDALTNRCCLKDVSDEFLELIAGLAKGEQQQKLRDLIDSDEIDEMDVLDVLHDFPSVRPSVQEFIASLTELAPRLYSIASSKSVVGEAVHLTVGRVIKEYRNRERKGVASTMFSDRMLPGNELRVFIQKSHGFGVPADDNLPLIMIGPGTGIAPFRAFLQERHARKSRGKNWLFFGDQKSATDFLYEEELNRYLENGLLSRLDTAFSRDQEEKFYVQNRMLENAQELFNWLEAGAWVCVCGDAKRMAVDVDKALHEVIVTAGGKTLEEAKDYVRNMHKSGRYVRDIY